MTSAHPPAITCPATRDAIKDSAFKSGVLPWLALIVGILSLPAMVVFINLGDPGHSRTVVQIAKAGNIVAILLFCAGLLGACLVWRRQRVLQALRHPWTEWRVSYREGNTEFLVLRDPGNNPVSELTISSWRHSHGEVVNHNTPTVWFAGNPYKRGVISKPGGATPLYVFRYGKQRPIPSDAP